MDDPKKVRVSLGTAILLGLKRGGLPVSPTTAYLMVGERCVNNCSFCTQAKSSDSRAGMLSRVSWPEFDLDRVIGSLYGAKDRGLGRICFQCLNDPVSLVDLPELTRRIFDASGLPISVSITPISGEKLKELKNSGVERAGIALDGASESIFDRIKGEIVGNPYTWEGIWDTLTRAIKVFGKGNVSTHIIVGMGETDRDVRDTMVRSSKMGIAVSLFAYTPMRGVSFKGDPPPLGRYRALQIMRYGMMEKGLLDLFGFDENGKMDRIDIDPLLSGNGCRDAFRTRGCPDCNRPYYNERPTGPMFNYPGPLTFEEFEEGVMDALKYVNN